MKPIILFLSTGFGSGYLPRAPGTWGSLVALLLFPFLLKLPPALLALTIITTFFVGVWSSQKTEEILQKHDPSIVVIDEVVGMWITLWAHAFNWKIGIIGFFLFRLFDIWKPGPVRWMQDKLPGGWGIMMDDVLAGVFANIVLIGVVRFL